MDVELIPRLDAPSHASNGALTMSAKTNIAALAVILTALAAPAFAGDLNPATELQDGGRYFGIDYTANPQHLSGAHASTDSSSGGLAPVLRWHHLPEFP